MTTSERYRCREASRARGEPLFATASTVRRWLLIERNGPWGSSALAESRIEPIVAQKIAALGRSIGARILLIKRPGRYEQEGVTVFAAFSGRRSRWLERLELHTYEALLTHDFSGLRRGEDGSVGGARLTQPAFFVCTHGKHDPCCAEHGRPVAQALADAFDEHAWETSHIGGDRFAANMLVLPHGIYYGRVPVDRAEALAEGVAHGTLDLAHYRGRSAYSFTVQAAERFARERTGLLGIDDLAFVDHRRSEAGVSCVRFTVRDGRVLQVELVSAPDVEVHRLTCHASRPLAGPRHRLVSMREILEERSGR